MAMKKTPVQFLNERCAKQGLHLATYEFQQIQALPTTVFQATCILKLNDTTTFIAIGLGQKKKDAQHNAAKAMFDDKLKIAHDDQVGFGALAQAQTTNAAVSRVLVNQKKAIETPVDDGDYPGATRGNPIAELDDYTRRYRLPEPQYDMTLEGDGPSHCPVFSVPCSVGNLSRSGRSKTRKMAKRIAAVKIMHELRNLHAATGSFGQNEVPMDTTTLDSDQREILQQLTLLETNNNPQLNGGRIKTYQDFLTEGNSGSEFYNKLRNHAGPHFQQLLTLARNIEENQPLVAHPHEFYEDWLQAHEKGVMGFFEELKQELNFQDIWNPVKNDGEKYMVVLLVRLPGIEFEPTAVKVGHGLNSLKEKAVIDFISYLGTMSMSQNGHKKPV